LVLVAVGIAFWSLVCIVNAVVRGGRSTGQPYPPTPPAGRSHAARPTAVPAALASPAAVDAGSGLTPTATAALTLAPRSLLNYRITQTITHETSVSLHYVSDGPIRLPDVALNIGYVATLPRPSVPPGARRITVRGHRGLRTDAGGMSGLAWHSGTWTFLLATQSDQGPGQFHIVDAIAHAIAEHADRQPVIRFVPPR
jgi:hypothetical protein